MSGDAERYRYGDLGRVALIALFVTALVTAQMISVKQLAVGLPLALPLVGALLVFPGGTLAYAVTFFASDCVSELYGKRFARTVVNVGFFMNFVFLALVWLTIEARPAPFMQDSFLAAFRTVLGPSTHIVLGSLFAYVVSQNWDVVAFHWIRERTGPDYLWARNVGSTMTSQFLDTVIFSVVAFWAAPTLLPVGVDPRAWAAIGSIIAGQYLAKLAIAVVDTPFVYATVAAIRGVGADTFAGGLAE